MTVGSTAGFAETGVLVVDKEVISYSRKTPTAFLGLSRGYARMHADGVPAVVHALRRQPPPLVFVVQAFRCASRI
jgi:hypothetical protein